MNYKVKVNNEAESKEVQELFFELGYDFYFGGKLYCNTHLGLVTANKEGLMANIELDGFEYKELTIQQLRDLVVLKRNSIEDSTHVGKSGSQYYIGDKSYFWDGIKWEQRDFAYIANLKPIKEKGMENIKVCVKHNDWSEVFDMLVELGAKHLTVKSEYVENFGWLFVHEDVIWIGLLPHNKKECREVEFSELKDMVVLKRNSVYDATHTTTDDVWKFYIGYDTYCYERKDGVIGWHKEDSKCYDLKPIEEKGMKEFLVENDFVESIWERNESENMKEFLVNYDNKWTLRLLDSDTEENSYRVAVPRGADVFWEEDGYCWFTTQLMGYRDARMVWQRSEIESLNDQYVETINATIDGVEAFNAIANDIDVQYRFAGGKWKDYTQDLNHEGSKLKAVHFLCDYCEFRYKPKTIVVNGVEYEDEQEATDAVKDYFK